MQNIEMIKKLIKTPFSTTQQAINFNNVQIELVPVIAKVFQGIFNFCVYFDALPLPAEERNTGNR